LAEALKQKFRHIRTPAQSDGEDQSFSDSDSD
jgi:hypothetical protein